jgi:hypothetical protein
MLSETGCGSRAVHLSFCSRNSCCLNTTCLVDDYASHYGKHTCRVFALTPHKNFVLRLTPDSFAIGLESVFALGHGMHMLNHLQSQIDTSLCSHIKCTC